MGEEKKKVLYLEAHKRDFVQSFLKHNPNYHLRNDDGKIDWQRRMHHSPPWIYCKPAIGRNCHFYHKLLFDVVFKQRWIPSACLDCWKVVVAPKTLRELMTMVMMQRQLQIPSKAGSEFERENTPRLYGAYFYNNSYEDGHKTWQFVMDEFAKKKTYSGTFLEVPFEGQFEDDIQDRCILKRGCTEYEQNTSTSSELWDEKVTPEQLEIETIAEDVFVLDAPNLTQSEHQIAHIISYWIHWAYQLGDETYKDFTDGRDLFAVCKQYQDEPLDFFEKRKQEECKENGKEIERPDFRRSA